MIGKRILVFLAAVALSLTAAADTEASAFLGIGMPQESTVSVNSEMIRKAAIQTNDTIPTDGSGGAFGYGVIFLGADGNADLSNIIVSTTHAGVQDSEAQNDANDPVFHNHYVSLTNNQNDAKCPGLEVVDITFQQPGSTSVDGSMVSLSDVPFMFSGTHSLTNDAVSFTGSGHVAKIVSFTINPVNGDGETDVANIAAVCINDVSLVDPTTLRFTAEERSWLAANPTINVGYASWAPLEYIDDSGNLAGLSGDMAADFSRLGGSEFAAVPGLTWTTSLEGIRDGTVDVVFMAQDTAERRSNYNMAFTEPWLTVPNNIITKGVRSDITADSLGSFKVVGVKDYAVNAWIRDNYDGINLVEASSYLEALEAVDSGTADVFVDPWVVASHNAMEHGIASLADSGSLPAAADYRLSVGYNADNTILGSTVQKMLDMTRTPALSDVTVSSTRTCR